MSNETISIEITKDERDFLVDNALNGLWNYCHERLTNGSALGDIEIQQLQKMKDESKRLMKKLDPSIF